MLWVEDAIKSEATASFRAAFRPILLTLIDTEYIEKWKKKQNIREMEKLNNVAI